MRGFRLIRPPVAERGVRPAVHDACLFGARRVFRTGRVGAPRVRPSFVDYGIFVGRLYASMYQSSRIRSFHIRQPWLAVSYCVPTMKSFSSSDFMRRNRKLENRYIKYMIGLRCIVRFCHVFLQGMPERSGRSRRDSDGFSQPGQSNEPRGGARSGSLAFCPAARSVPERGNRRRAFRSGVALRWTNDENVIPLPP